MRSRHPVAIDSKGLRIVALDLPTSHQGMQDTKGDEFTGRMLGATNPMLMEIVGTEHGLTQLLTHDYWRFLITSESSGYYS